MVHYCSLVNILNILLYCFLASFTPSRSSSKFQPNSSTIFLLPAVIATIELQYLCTLRAPASIWLSVSVTLMTPPRCPILICIFFYPISHGDCTPSWFPSFSSDSNSFPFTGNIAPTECFVGGVVSPQISYDEVFPPSTLECDCVWK